MTALTTAQMKAALATINPPAPQAPNKGELIVADVLAGVAATAIHSVENAGANTLDFMDRVKTGYQYQRAVQKGLLDTTPEPAATPKARAKPAKSN